MAETTRTVFRKESEQQGFSRVTDALEMRRLIARAIETSASVEVRLPSCRFSSTIMDCSDPKIGIQIQVPKEARQALEKQAKPDAEAECMLIAFLEGQILLCIRSMRISIAEDAVLVPPPWDIFKLQRRKEPRFEIPRGYEIFVKMDALDGSKSRVQRRLVDISTSGLGFHVASTQEASFYKMGLFLRRLCLTIEGRQIFIDAQVRSTLEIQDHPTLTGMKIGVKFMRIGPLDARHIAVYVVKNLAQLMG